MNKSIEQIFVNLIQSYMDLPDNYGQDNLGNDIPCVSIANQNLKLFNTPKMQITIKTLSSNVFASKCYNRTVEIEGQEVYQEIVDLNDQKIIQIDVFSRNNEALERYNEVQLALNSTLAQESQEKYHFKIAHISTAINLSGLDGGSEINRFSIRINVLSWEQKIKSVSYYDKFEAFIETENSEYSLKFYEEEEGE